MELLNILLMAGQGEGKGGVEMNMVIMLGMVAVLYFFMIRPQMKKAKQQKEFTASVGEGDNIITISGMHGKILRINDDATMQVEIGRNNTVKMERSSISMEMTKAMQEKATKEVATNA